MSQAIGMELVPPLHRTFDPDEALEFHAARLVILLEVCGHGAKSKRIDGLEFRPRQRPGHGQRVGGRRLRRRPGEDDASAVLRLALEGGAGQLGAG